jgi:hypothetical protein
LTVLRRSPALKTPPKRPQTRTGLCVCEGCRPAFSTHANMRRWFPTQGETLRIYSGRALAYRTPGRGPWRSFLTLNPPLVPPPPKRIARRRPPLPVAKGRLHSPRAAARRRQPGGGSSRAPAGRPVHITTHVAPSTRPCMRRRSCRSRSTVLSVESSVSRSPASPSGANRSSSLGRGIR